VSLGHGKSGLSWTGATRAIVVPLSTSAAQARRGPTAVPLAPGSAGLKKGGIALCHQVTTLDRAKLTEQLGTLPSDVMSQLEEGLRAALDLA